MVDAGCNEWLMQGVLRDCLYLEGKKGLWDNGRLSCCHNARVVTMHVMLTTSPCSIVVVLNQITHHMHHVSGQCPALHWQVNGWNQGGQGSA